MQHLIGSTFVEIVLSNTGADDAENAPNRHALHDSNVDVTDRMLGSGHIGHNKFVVYVDSRNVPTAVLTGSTNWTSNAICAQTNNALIIESPALAAVYMDYWNRLKADTTAAPPFQAPAFRTANNAAHGLNLEDGSAAVELWFSPNTPQLRKPAGHPTEPSDLHEVFSVIKGAKQAVLFLAFQPGSPSIMDAVADAQAANKDLFVRGALTDKKAANDYDVQLFHLTGEHSDATVIPATAIHDQFDAWEKEMLSAGHAVIHDKIVVVDPFSDDCAVITGSHNLGYAASYGNDENLLIFRRHRGLAEAYATHVMDVYDHYRFRYLLQTQGARKTSSMLNGTDAWQDKYFGPGNDGGKELTFWLKSTPIAEALATGAVSSDALVPPKPAAPPARAAQPSRQGSAKPPRGNASVATPPARPQHRPFVPAGKHK